MRVTSEQTDFIRQRGPVTPSPGQSYGQSLECAVRGFQFVWQVYLGIDEAPRDLVVRTALSAQYPED